MPAANEKLPHSALFAGKYRDVGHGDWNLVSFRSAEVRGGFQTLEAFVRTNWGGGAKHDESKTVMALVRSSIYGAAALRSVPK